jgi:hypothetical protein
LAETDPLLFNSLLDNVMVGGLKQDSTCGITIVVPKLDGYSAAI